VTGGGQALLDSNSHGLGSGAKQNQARPNKSKLNGLDLFGFIRPNRDFSMGYGESK
jgi:hypothetical protein